MPEAPSTPVRATTRASVTGDDLAEPTRILRGELGGPHLVPLVGVEALPGTTALVRTVVHLHDLPTSLSPHGWRLTGSRSGTDLASRRARSQHASLLGLTADLARGQALGPTVVDVVGPATLAARLALPGGEPVVSDAGALRDVAQAWAESMTALAAAAQASLPGSTVVFDVAEPDLAAVTSGSVRSSSGYRLLPSWDRAEIAAAWAALAAGTRTILPVEAARLSAPADLPELGDAGDEAAPRVAVRLKLPSTPEGFVPVAAWVEAGHDVVVDVPTPAPAPGRIPALARSVALPWRRLGLEAAQLDRLVVSTSDTGPVSPDRMRSLAATARDAADALDMVRHDDLEAIS